MTVQYSVAARNAQLDAFETTTGTSAKLQLRTASAPANCAAANTGTLLCEMSLPSDWMAAASAGSKALLGTWTGTGVAAGTAAHFRIFDTAGTTCHAQGSAGANTVIATNALTSANGNVLNFASTTGVAVGQSISGTGIVAGSTVLAFTGTTVTMSQATTAGVANAASITFGSDMALDNTSIAVSQTVNVTSFTLARGNA